MSLTISGCGNFKTSSLSGAKRRQLGLFSLLLSSFISASNVIGEWPSVSDNNTNRILPCFSVSLYVHATCVVWLQCVSCTLYIAWRSNFDSSPFSCRAFLCLCHFFWHTSSWPILGSFYWGRLLWCTEAYHLFASSFFYSSQGELCMHRSSLL